jgi:GntR family transcriptional repressor for pyruvate dehydrogenase complex
MEEKEISNTGVLINNKSKSQQAREIIMERISSGMWPAGTKLPSEFDLCKEFGISRVSIRHAISMLSGQGILSVRQGQGTFVNEIKPTGYFDSLKQLTMMDPVEYMEVQKFRLMIEPVIAAEAAKNTDSARLAELKECIRLQQFFMEKQDQLGYARMDQHFHELLAGTTENSLVVKVMSILRDLMDVAMEHTTAVTGFEEGIEYHTKILECIEKGSAKKAAAVMKTHITNNIRSWKKVAD